MKYFERDHIHVTFIRVYCYSHSIFIISIVANLLLCPILSKTLLYLCLYKKKKQCLQIWYTIRGFRQTLRGLGRHTSQIKENCVHAKLLQSCPILCDPMDCSLPGFSVLGILQARILEWVAMPHPSVVSNPFLGLFYDCFQIFATLKYILRYGNELSASLSFQCVVFFFFFGLFVSMS